MNTYFVYILTNINKTVLYVGFTDDIFRRTQEHKEKRFEGFTKFYNVDRLVYFEKHDTAETAMKREKQIKKWNRKWKEKLINIQNPEWRDLSEGFNKKISDLEFLDILFHKSYDRK
ncbi:MAG TPA: GIY-YIG nuclease family protein [Ignavibacteria bacterium]|nr:GIY-YIG nuclease family protein [Ignavibacteria bacterium]